MFALILLPPSARSFPAAIINSLVKEEARRRTMWLRRLRLRVQRSDFLRANPPCNRQQHAGILIRHERRGYRNAKITRGDIRAGSTPGNWESILFCHFRPINYEKESILYNKESILNWFPIDSDSKIFGNWPSARESNCYFSHCILVWKGGLKWMNDADYFLSGNRQESVGKRAPDENGRKWVRKIGQ